MNGQIIAIHTSYNGEEIALDSNGRVWRHSRTQFGAEGPTWKEVPTTEFAHMDDAPVLAEGKIVKGKA